MRHEDDPMSSGSTDRDLPFLSAGVIWVGIRQGQWVKENCRRVVKGHTVLLEIGLGLRRMPLIDYRFSLPQRSAPVGGRMKLPPGTAYQGKAQASGAVLDIKVMSPGEAP